jgi:alanyl-tRNA synthetase/REP element-mobilizing transposase RayT
MTSQQIRQSFLDFFKSKQHTIVPSASLMPDSPNLLFTNAGMNQFVPIFLGQTKCPYTPGRAADTQKCIRAGGKHNDLDDVGLDTYHHTFFEMLGNWSFGDYFKQEAIEWAWELVINVWKFPPQRLYATIYQPDKAAGDPAERDEEAWNFWAEKFRNVGLDPAVHIVNGNKKDNFWMMGETGPCGPCSELHVDLTPAGDTCGKLVNQGTAECIEIWNLVFIQFNANPDGTFSPLPAQHVDTGMGFERVTSIIQGTKGLTDFANAKISNYETDIFRPIFDAIEKFSGKRYGSTLPKSGSTGDTEQEKIDVAFRVIGDHIRTLSFAIADGIQPGNTDRNYVLRRILRRAVRYGRTLGFHEPFFYKLVDVLAATMGDVFPEIRAKKKHVQDVIRIEEEAFNKTLDRGIELFESEVARLRGGEAAPGSARGPRAEAGGPPASRPSNIFSLEGKPVTIESAQGATYSKRRVPHFEKPWAIYHITLTTLERRQLEPADRDIVFACIRHWNNRRYRLIAACVMPDHAHFIIQPGIESQDPDGNPLFYSLSTILHTIKSFTAHEINKRGGESGGVWEKEKFDRYIGTDSDLEEKFYYVCRNPWDSGLVQPNEPWPWIWTPEYESWRAGAPGSAGLAGTAGGPPDSSPTQTGSTHSETEKSDERGVRRPAEHSTPAACAPRGAAAAAPDISGNFAFKLYDTYGFPLDLTELMARERGLTVDKEGFEKLMEEQRARARAAQKKEVISLSEIQTTTPTKFVGFENLAVPAKVLEVVSLKDKTAVILDTSACYAEMGGQVGDTGELTGGGQLWRITNTQKSGNTWLHFLETENLKLETAPAIDSTVTLSVEVNRRRAIERHHSVTHLLHWALHEVVSKEASQKGSFVGPDKLTFDFNSAALTPQQVADIEQLVNERIVENAGISWTEVAYADVKSRKDVMQFFGDKYGDTVRVVQIGGAAGRLDGYSMELCGGTHTRATGEIGLFRIVGESAIAAGVRRIEAVAGLTAYDVMRLDRELIKTVAGKVNSPIHELEKKIESLLAQQKALEKEVQISLQRNASNAASELLGSAQTVNGIPVITHNLGSANGDFLQAIADSLKGRFQGVVVLGGGSENAVALVATVSPEFTAMVQAGKLIQAIAPIVGGKGGGKPDNARGGGKEVSKLDEALAKVRDLLGQTK